MDRTFHYWDPKTLKPHPLSAAIYGESVRDELLESVRDEGVHNAILCAPGRLMVSGHERCRAAIKAGIDKVPVIVDNGLTDPLNIERLVITSNTLSRERTTEQKAREFIELKRINEALAAKRHGRKGEGQGRSADIAAEQVGLSRNVAAQAEKVIEAIDSLPSKKAEELRETLEEKGVAAAAREIDSNVSQSGTHSSGAAEKPHVLTRDEAMNAHNSELESTAREITKFIDAIPDTPWITHNQRLAITNHLKSAAAGIRACKGYKECTKCKTSCKWCRGTGFMTRTTYDAN